MDKSDERTAAALFTAIERRLWGTLVFLIIYIAVGIASLIVVRGQLVYLREELDKLNVSFLAMTSLRMNEVQYFEGRVRSLELFMATKGYHPPKDGHKDYVDGVAVGESRRKLYNVIKKGLKAKDSE